MSIKDNFINKYSLSKTLRFSLLPVGKTEENFNAKLLLEKDEKLAEEYEKVKKIIDRYHRSFIESILSSFILDGVAEYSELYYRKQKDEKTLKTIEKAENDFRKSIVKAFTSSSIFKKLFGREIITELLPQFLVDENEIHSVALFQNFSTYFRGFNENQKNMYSSEPQATAIAYRCINENLPKFLDNALIFGKIKEDLKDEIDKLNQDFCGIYGVEISDIFEIDYFSFVLAQSGIDRYNCIIGGYTCEDGTKVQGLNEYINLYNQRVAGKDKSKRLPFIKPLYKQILTEEGKISFVPDKFLTDDELINSVNEFYKNTISETVDDFVTLFSELYDYSKDGIFVRSGTPITSLANAVFGNWNVFSEAWNSEYMEKNPLKSGKSEEKYFELLKKEYNKIKSFSLAELERLGAKNNEVFNDNCIISYFTNSVLEGVNNIKNAYREAMPVLEKEYGLNNDKKLCNNDFAIELIKNLLDSIKDFEKNIKPLLGTGREENKDNVFYGIFTPLYDRLSLINKIYDKVRNYLTQKPYSKDKIKLNFENPQFLDGWDRNKERDYRTVILKKENNFYLAIMDKSNNKAFLTPPYVQGESCYEKIEYKLLPGPNKMLPKVFFAASNIEYYNPNAEIISIRNNESFKKGANFNLKDCHKLIDFFKGCIQKHNDWSQFGFKFSPTENYNDISEFYNEVSKQGYTIRYENVSENYINYLIEKGELYLFQIYNKDFSKYSHGKPNLHTSYFKMLFDERNLKDVVYQLNGGAEMFYRKASINHNEMVVHPANQSIDNKNPLNPKKQSVFAYDIVKDARFTKHQFSLHLPITLNFKAEGQEYINNDVRLAVKNGTNNYVIGIDRGERNLLYLCVIDSRGNIVEQKSLNEIISENNHKVDYHSLLSKKEAERDAARKSWGTVENIKELKEGYLSQVIHKICEMVIKYDAIIAMEDLNFGFKKGRFKVEKQVYQKFENMLISKLNYLVDKNAEADEKGGLLNAYQLTNKVVGVNKGRQNGIIFYVPAWLTSKIDPTTGFADLLHPRFTSITESKDFVERIDSIIFNADENVFEFNIDLEKFKNTSSAFKKCWTICTNGERIRTFRNKDKNNMWDNEVVILTNAFKDLFEEAQIDINISIKPQILALNNKSFFQKFIHLLALTLQMRNSITGTDVDYLISPVKNKYGEFFDSRICNSNLPENADANGAYNIARKALWAMNVLKNTPDEKLRDADLFIRNSDWLELAQK